MNDARKSLGQASFLWNRRDLLRVGSIGLASSLLPDAFASAMGPTRVESVIFLWMAGGVTHIDSLDPKPDAPEEVRGDLKAIATALPGVRFCETMPCLARIADRLSVVRSYSHESNDHFESQVYALSGRKVVPGRLNEHPNIGAIVSYLKGPRSGFPGYLAVPGGTRPGPPPTNLFTGGWLGDAYAPFATGGDPKEPDFTVAVRKVKGEPPREFEEDLAPASLDFPAGLTRERIASRGSLRGRIEQTLSWAAKSDRFEAVDRHYSGAFNLLDSAAVRNAFDLAVESDATKMRYGKSKIGRRCLLARRLVEAGARFVMVDYGYDNHYGNLWDNHRAAGQNQPPIVEMAKLPYHVAGIDRAFAALISDLAARGRLDSTLVVFMTEFGRTPKINAAGGRDHWGAAGSIFFAGGGAKEGQVIGATDKHAAFPLGRCRSPADVAATIYQSLGISPDTILYDRQARPMAVLPKGEPIAGIFG